MTKRNYIPEEIDQQTPAAYETATQHKAVVEDADYLVSPPAMRLEMLYGLIGEIAITASAGREVNPVSVALGAIVRLSALVGRDIYFQVGDEQHTLNQYALHVGRSALGAKGESFALLKRIENQLKKVKPIGVTGILGQSHTAGLSSREGLAGLVFDSYTQGDVLVPGIADKRAFLRESEFANLLAQSKRDGNTISSALRDIWDSGQSIKPLTKSQKMVATDPHIALHGAITPTELREKLSTGEASNGFINRFIIIFAERIGLVPFPPETKQKDVDFLANRIKGFVAWALGRYPIDTYTRKMMLSADAEALWKKAYLRLKKRTTYGEMINAILERRAPITLRLAALFAATDQTLIIEEHHLRAALAWAEFHRESVIYVFGADTQAQKKAQQQNEYRTRVMGAMNGGDWVTRSDLHRAFSGRANKAVLDEVLAALLADRVIERTETKNQTNAGKKVSYRVAKTTKTAKTMDESGFASRVFAANSCENQNQTFNGSGVIGQFAEIRKEFSDEESRQNKEFAEFAEFAAEKENDTGEFIKEVEL